MCRNKAEAAIRPHHGMCLAYFKGYGYSDGFSVHMAEMLERLEQNIPVELIVRTDEICSACPNNQNGSCLSADRVTCFDQAVLDCCGLEEGAVLPFLDFAEVVQKQILDPGKRAKICGGCQWNKICSTQKSRWEK